MHEHDEPSRATSRRHFLTVAGAAAATAAIGIPLAAGGPASAAAPEAGSTPTRPAVAPRRRRAAFGPVRQIDAGVLSVGYVELGPVSGDPVVLMHGFPYDIHSFEEVAPLLAARGYRVIVPYFRGHGTTTFLDAATPRDADQAAFALDITALMDALGIDRAILAGYDWGSRTGDIIAALWPERVTALVSVTGYLITNLKANLGPQLPAVENDWWYQYYFATERGAQGLHQYKTELGELNFQMNSPTWKFSDETYARTAAAFQNPDYEAIVLGNYRWRLSIAPSEPAYDAYEAILQNTPAIAVPTITIDGADDPFTPTGDGGTYRAHFTGAYEHRTFKVGHNVPQEAPRAFAQAVVDAGRLA